MRLGGLLKGRSIANMAGSSEEWKEVDYYPDDRDQKALIRDFTCKDFADALEFVNKVAELAEKENHHPDISFGWGYVRIWLTTHSKHAITDKDYSLATLIDSLL